VDWAETLNMSSPQRPQKLLDQVRDAIRLKHYSIPTEESYVNWIRRYILYHNKRQPQEMGVPEIEAFLSYLAVEEQVAASTQNQALHEVLFLYQYVLKQDLESPLKIGRAKRWIPQVFYRLIRDGHLARSTSNQFDSRGRLPVCPTSCCKI
jgi:site-specific recombinase XerD